MSVSLLSRTIPRSTRATAASSGCTQCQDGYRPPYSLRALLPLSDHQVMEQADAVFCTCTAGQARRALYARRQEDWDRWTATTAVERAARDAAAAAATTAALIDAPPLYQRLADLDAIERLAAGDPKSTDGMRAARMLIESGAIQTRTGQEKNSLLLWGRTGTAKTSLATAVYVAMQRKGASGVWTTYAGLLKAIRAGYKTDSAYELVARCETVGVLLIDEFGQDQHATPTEHTREMMANIIYARHDYERPTLFTTNATPAQLQAAFDRAIWARIAEMAAVLEFGCTDYREQRGAA